ncbi:MAG: YSC84-related protein [Holophagae bacterium]|jgi:lipid-binding SYLF domain-containing protein
MTLSFRTVLLFASCIALLLTTTPCQAQDSNDDWRSLKAESKRLKIDDMSNLVRDKVLANDPKAQDLYDSAYGWAAFDNLKVAFGISGGAGNGVAVNKQTGERTYMKMGTGGIGIGLGGQSYQVLFFFQDRRTFERFLDEGWTADASAQAAAGTEGANAATGFVNGVAVWQMTEKGLMASADVSGTKYWINKKLN